MIVLVSNCRGWLRRGIAHRWVRFVLVGAANTAFSYGIYAALLASGLDYRAASLGSIVLGVLVSYWTQGSLVFGHRSAAAFLRFVAVWMAIYIVHIGIIGLYLRLGMTAYWAGVAAIPVLAVLSYLMQKFAVFRS